MIPNITHSTGSGNYLGYNLGDKKEQYQKVQFLAAEGVVLDDRLVDRLNQNWKDGDNKGYQDFRKVSMAIANDLDDQFRAQASLNDRPKIRTINVSLSYSPKDTDKVNEMVYDKTRDDYVPLRLKMGREFLDGMGFGDIQYVAVSHLGTHCAHDHYAINTIRSDGSTISLKFDFVRAQKIAAEIRQKYGLTAPDESLQMIAPKAKDALKQSCSWDEYEQRLQKHGIGLVYSDHSKNGRGYGVSYSFNKKVIPGSKLHRSLTYGQVNAVLQRNLAALQALQDEPMKGYEEVAAAIETAKETKEAAAKPKEGKNNRNRNIYESHYKPLIDKVQNSIEDTLAMGDYLREHIGECSQELDEKYNLLRNINQQIDLAKVDLDMASTSKELVTALAGLISIVNPVAASILLLIGSIIAEADRQAAYETRNALYTKAKSIRQDIHRIKVQQEEYRAEDVEMKDALIKDKAAKTELYHELNTLKEQLSKPVQPSEKEKHEMQIQELKRLFPFTDPGHIFYIVHSETDASIFHCGNESIRFRKTTFGGNFEEDKIEAARCTLKHRGYMVASDRGPDGELGFYSQLLNEQKYKDYRVGSMHIQPDGNIIFGKEKIFGNAERTEPAFKHDSSPTVVVQQKVKEQQSVPAVKPKQVATNDLETVPVHQQSAAPAPTVTPVAEKKPEQVATPASKTSAIKSKSDPVHMASKTTNSDLTDEIHVTQSDYYSKKKLPVGFSLFLRDNRIVLQTPVSNQVVPCPDGLYIVRKNEKYECMTKSAYEVFKQGKRRKKAKEKYKQFTSSGIKQKILK